MNAVYIVKRPNVVQFSVFNFARFKNFSFVADTDGQTDFTFDVTPLNIMVLGINGAVQDGGKTPPDYVFSGVNLTLSEGVDAGTLVYGVIQY